jgi:D-alanine transaminase
MSINAYYNGKFCECGEIAVPLTDRAVFFGDGIYDAAIGKNGKIFMEKEHVDRFVSNAKALNIPLPLPAEDIIRTLRKVAGGIKEQAFFIYFHLTRFSSERSHAYPDTERSNFLVTANPISLKEPHQTLALIEADDIRHSMCHIKTLNLIPAVMAAKKAEVRGADEAVFHRGETVTECAHSNIHIIKNGKIITHPTDNLILPGISRAHMLRVAALLSIPVEERPFSLSELRFADEVLITSSSKLCLRAKSFMDVRYDTERRTEGLGICTKMREDFEKMTI